VLGQDVGSAPSVGLMQSVALALEECVLFR
jgi:hypothetical protein